MNTPARHEAERGHSMGGMSETPVRRLDETDETETRTLLVGRRIVAAERGHFDTPSPYYQAEGRLTLDDGTQVLVVPNTGGCSCSAGDYELGHLATVDNVVTSVRLACETTGGDEFEPDQSYRIYVIADAVEVNVMTIDGNDGNGYYGTGYELFVVPA